MLAEQLDRGRTTGEPELADDGGNVGPDRAGRQDQSPGDSARGMALREQTEYLPLTAGQAPAEAIVRYALPPARFTPMEVLDHPRDQCPRHGRLTRKNSVEFVRQPPQVHRFQQIPVGSGSQRGEEVSIVIRDGEHDNLCLR